MTTLVTKAISDMGTVHELTRPVSASDIKIRRVDYHSLVDRGSIVAEIIVELYPECSAGAYSKLAECPIVKPGRNQKQRQEAIVSTTLGCKPATVADLPEHMQANLVAEMQAKVDERVRQLNWDTLDLVKRTGRNIVSRLTQEFEPELREKLRELDEQISVLRVQRKALKHELHLKGLRALAEHSKTQPWNKLISADEILALPLDSTPFD